jgi:hypothetical protein
VLVREEVMPRLLTHPRRSLYLSLAGYWEAQERRTTPFTPAVQIAYALDEALAELLEEGVDARIARYAAAATLLRAGFTRLGLQGLLPPERRSNSITALTSRPAHLRDAARRPQAAGFVIYEGQGGSARSVPHRQHGPSRRPDFERCWWPSARCCGHDRDRARGRGGENASCPLRAAARNVSSRSAGGACSHACWWVSRAPGCATPWW